MMKQNFIFKEAHTHRRGTTREFPLIWTPDLFIMFSLATTTPIVQSFGDYKIAAFKSNQHQEPEIPTVL
jgi:hypothetical protein